VGGWLFRQDSRSRANQGRHRPVHLGAIRGILKIRQTPMLGIGVYQALDKIGNYPEVKEYLKTLINEEPEICW